MVRITQSLGGSYTVLIKGNLARIEGSDSDAIGIEPSEDLNGKNIEINGLGFKVEKPVNRCLAINCNPSNGIRDKNVLKSMLDIQDKKPPVFAVKLIPLNSEGIISIGNDLIIN